MMHEHHKVQLSKDPVLGPSGDFFSANTIGKLSMTTLDGNQGEFSLILLFTLHHCAQHFRTQKIPELSSAQPGLQFVSVKISINSVHTTISW